MLHQELAATRTAKAQAAAQLAACRAHIAAGRVPESTSASGRLELHHKGARRIDSERSAAGMPANWSQLSDLGWPSEEEAALAKLRPS